MSVISPRSVAGICYQAGPVHDCVTPYTTLGRSVDAECRLARVRPVVLARDCQKRLNNE